MEEPTNSFPIKSTEILKEALKNSEILLSHATAHGLEIDKKLIQTIVESKKFEAFDLWDDAKEIEFWMAYKEMSKLVQPVTIKSLKASQEVEVRNPNWLTKLFKIKIRLALSHRAVRTYTVLTLFFMVIMLTIQIYALKGTTLLNTVHNWDIRLSEIEKRMTELMLQQNAEAKIEKDRLENEIDEVNRKKMSTIQLLEPWVRFISNVTRSVNAKYYASNQPNQQGPRTLPSAVIDENISIVQEAQNYVLIIGLYILPLLYGLLGGFAFVLRSLVEETKNLIFSKESNIKYTLRIHLGALAGLAIGLLWNDIEKQQLGFIASLSPLALAFIAGYSVEFLFTGIDRIIATFGRKKGCE